MSKTLNSCQGAVLGGALLAIFGLGCGSSSSSPGGSGGSSTGGSASGGATQTSTGGTTQPPGSGGATSSSGGAPASSGGAPGTGGQATTGTGGAVAPGSGGAAPTGGNSAGGGPAGGKPGTGGAGGSGKAGSSGTATGGTQGGGGAGTSNNPIMAGGDSKCATPMVAIGSLCDGFEGPAIGATGSPFMADPMNMGSTVVVDTTKPYRGTKSAHLKMAADRVFITESGTFTQPGSVATNDNMWGRMFVFATAPMTAGGHTVFIRLEDPLLTGMSLELHVAGGHDGVFTSEMRFSNADHWNDTTIPVPLATPTWECWEWHTTAMNTLEFYINGKIQAPMTVTAAKNYPFPTFKKLSLGFLSFRGNANMEMWIDEVAIGTSQIGCDN
jgi:hypothetical protein